MVKVSALVLLLPSLLLAAVPPSIDRPVTDTQGLLSPAQTETVARELVRLREEAGTQMAVLIVDTTGGEPIEDYAMRAAQVWRGGQKGADNGLLYVLAVKDRRMRLEVGYGLEEHLPDGAVRLLLDAQGPLMRERNYTDALVNIIHGVRERLPASATAKPQAPAASPSASNFNPVAPDEYAAVAFGSFTAYFLSLLLCIVLRPGLRDWMGERVALGISGVLSALALLFLFLVIAKSDPINLWTLAWSFCLYGAMMAGCRFLILRDGWARWGVCSMVGLFLGSPFTWALVGEGRWVLLFNILLPLFFTTLFVAFFSLLPVFGHLLRALVWVFGGASTFSFWSREDAATYSSRSSSIKTPAPSSWTSSTPSRSSSSPRNSSSPRSSSSSRRSSSRSSSSSESSSSDSPSVLSSLWSVAASSSSSSDSSSNSWFSGSSSSDSSSSDSSSSSWSSDSSSSDSSSSSSSSDWSGGGGDFGGGGASSSW